MYISRFGLSIMQPMGIRDTPLHFQEGKKFCHGGFFFRRFTTVDFFPRHLRGGEFFSENFKQKEFPWRQGVIFFFASWRGRFLFFHPHGEGDFLKKLPTPLEIWWCVPNQKSLADKVFHKYHLPFESWNVGSYPKSKWNQLLPILHSCDLHHWKLYS